MERNLLRLQSGLFRDWQANTYSIICDGRKARDSEWMSGSAKAGTTAARHIYELGSGLYVPARSSAARVRRSAFSLDFRLTWMSATRQQCDGYARKTGL